MAFELDRWPPHHSGAHRVVREAEGDWEIRTFDPAEPCYRCRAKHRALDVQLRRRSDGLSLCSPSASTLDTWELYPYFDARYGPGPKALRFRSAERALTYLATRYPGQLEGFGTFSLVAYALSEPALDAV